MLILIRYMMRLLLVFDGELHQSTVCLLKWRVLGLFFLSSSFPIVGKYCVKNRVFPIVVITRLLGGVWGVWGVE